VWALRRLGNQIGRNVALGPTLTLGCGPFTIGDEASIMSFNSFRRMSSVEIGPRSFIGNLNQFSAAPGYQQFSQLVGKLILGESCIITNRHYFDCSGQIIMRPFSGIGGLRSIFQSHEIDLEDNETTVGRIVLGENAMTGTACVLLKDAYLPERSILAAGSLLTKAKQTDNLPARGLYAGVPARFIREVNPMKWWDRQSFNTPPTPFDDRQFRMGETSLG
jgi:acetyltransferase-like isoleucine patch superfamily enzyme